MFRHSTRLRTSPADIAQIERRMQALESQLERLADSASRSVSDAAGRTSAGVAETSERVGAAVAAALADIAERFRGSSRAASETTARLGSEAARYGNEAAKEAAKIGNDAVRRLVDEVERRPLMTLAVAAGVGLLVGLAGRGIDLGEKAPPRRPAKRSH
jgi:ElaB/YqjD/DUF883 family membrane-anchored ribosome-binding protein